MQRETTHGLSWFWNEYYGHSKATLSSLLDGLEDQSSTSLEGIEARANPFESLLVAWMSI